MPPTLSLFHDPVGDSPDLQRVLALPRRPRVMPGTATAEAMIRHVQSTYGRDNPNCSCSRIQDARGIRRKPCILTPNYAQAWAMYEMAVTGGVVGQLAVGSGKTFLDVMLPMAKSGCQTAIVLVPATLLRQLVTEYLLIAEHWRVPGISVDVPGNHPEVRRDNRPGAPLLRVMPYSRLQLADNTTYLERMKPDLIIVDEAQHLASAKSARGGRFLRYFATTPVKTALAAYSGTLTDDSLDDYQHFTILALGMGAPLPIDADALEEWKAAIDPSDWPAPEGALSRLKSDPDEDIQDAFHRRLVETPGIVMTAGASIDTPLEIRERPAPRMPDDPSEDPRAPGDEVLGVPSGWWPGCASALDRLRRDWVRPDGEELLEILPVARCARELACGLFLRWHFPRGESRSLVDEWLAARKAWRRELRDKLRARQPHLDSPFLCALAARRYWRVGNPREFDETGRPYDQQVPDELPEWDAETWPRWARVKEEVKPQTEVIRLDPFLARDAAEWARSNRGIVWWSTVGFGRWVSELSGLPLYGEGPEAAAAIVAEDGRRSVIASIRSHGTGRDGLQRLFSTQLVTQAMSSAVGYEQLFGRLSRIGQDAEVVSAWIYRHTEELRDSVDTALRRARYVGKTMGQAQRLTSSWLIDD